jgi:hypothetical protein
MNRQLLFFVTGIVSQVGVSTIAHAQTPDGTLILDLIANTAERLCYVIRDHRNASSAEAVNAVNLELSGLARRLVGAGLNRTEGITNEEYQNVLRKELANTFIKTFDCIQRVSNSLEAKMLPTHITKPPVP